MPLAHTVFHSQVLTTKTLPPGLKQIMSFVIQAVNFIKSSALSSRIFTKLCFEMNAESTQLLLHRGQMVVQGQSLETRV
jgi:hypothetical protein